VKIVDLNILLYALNRDAAHHAAVHRWWEEAINGEEAIGIPWVVISGFLRICTRPGILPNPLDPAGAIEIVDDWFTLETVRLVHEQEGHWPTLRALILEAGTAGNLVTDAHLAALAITHGATLVSCDSDFARFKGLRWLNPLNEPLGGR
jgi:toxin-antitoxin system PIN domain toxin